MLHLCRPPEVVHDTDGLGSGCVLCHEPDFLRGAFGDRTIIICDTCEREFHVGCLREQNRADLKEVRTAQHFDSPFPQARCTVGSTPSVHNTRHQPSQLPTPPAAAMAAQYSRGVQAADVRDHAKDAAAVSTHSASWLVAQYYTSQHGVCQLT
jgi:hypothetical protein